MCFKNQYYNELAFHYIFFGMRYLKKVLTRSDVVRSKRSTYIM